MMANERQFLLEYQEEGGNFYYNSMDEHHHPNTSGYRTIAICSFNECCDFSQAMKEKYDFGKRPYPTYDCILKEWQLLKRNQ